MINPTYLNYALPRAADTPPIRAILLEHADPVGPYGAKGLGEIVLMPTQAAVANAVAHATGVRVRDLPITPDKVLGGLHLKHPRARRHQPLWRRPSRWWIAAIRWAYPRGLHRLLHRHGTKLARRRSAQDVEEIVNPRTVDDALTALDTRSDARPLGGGTDLLPAREQELANPTTLVNLQRVEGLTRVEEDGAGDLLVGGAVTLAELLRSTPVASDTALRETVETIASTQIREMATVAGNLCQEKRCWFYRNGFDCYKRGGMTCPCYAVEGDHRHYHAAMGAHRCQAVTPSDLATTLTALDATFTIRGRGSQREVSASRFYTGPGETSLSSDELLTNVRVPAAARARRSRFAKLRLWEGDFALLSACVSIAIDDGGHVSTARVVVGAFAPTPYRVTKAEAYLLAGGLTDGAIARASHSVSREGHPLRDNAWKLEAAEGIVRRALVDIRDDAAS